MDGVLVDSEAVYQYDLMRFFREQKQRITQREASAFVGFIDAFYYRHIGELWDPKMT